MYFEYPNPNFFYMIENIYTNPLLDSDVHFILLHFLASSQVRVQFCGV